MRRTKAIIRWTLWQRRWSVFWWSLGIAALIAVTIAFYPSFADQSQQLNDSYQNLSETAKAFISDTNDFVSPEGYLSSQIFYLMLPLLLSVLAISLGSRLLAREEEEGTIELLLSRPVSRGKLLLAKGLSGLMIVAIVTLVALITAVGLCAAVNMDISLLKVAEATLLAALMAVFFGALAFWITTIGATARLASLGIPAAIGLGGYVIASLDKAVDWLEWPARFFPYHYYRPGEVLYGTYNWLNAVLIAGLIGLLALLSWRAFHKRDLHG